MKIDRGAWVMGGSTLVGTGVGLIFIQKSALLFAASLLIGMGLGLVIAATISRN